MLLGINAFDHRRPDHDVEPLFVERWSPRVMSGAPVDGSVLARLLEAARWAPSSYNDQPWHFVYAHRDTPHWAGFHDLLVEGNQRWCANAGVLLILFARNVMARNGKPSRTFGFDAGAAWQNFALQGARLGLVVHGMAGFDYDRAGAVVGAPDHYVPQAMAAVGWPGELDSLDAERREREKPTPRKPVAEIASEGRF